MLLMEDTIICRCENVTLKHILKTVEKYDSSVRETKLRTRAGMGFCGGRTCKNHIDKIINKNKKISNEFTTMKVQPPVRPITFGEIGDDYND
ncbi:(2Fe-2S)-binding protein [Mammaliicoccus lentus]|uniref:(2Fe-2S)-binding protein n=2 Tax=Mammaliicoccus lentus TaxID=42858 RepID=A0AAX3W6U8_MAMLE|nr:(2Fe-2S)-binding protein [Mammaliicoccus lentus]WHI60479.1 (2Fe-2S)-binding protein [Mammaliicoccus lentus]